MVDLWRLLQSAIAAGVDRAESIRLVHEGFSERLQHRDSRREGAKEGAWTRPQPFVSEVASGPLAAFAIGP